MEGFNQGKNPKGQYNNYRGQGRGRGKPNPIKYYRNKYDNKGQNSHHNQGHKNKPNIEQLFEIFPNAERKELYDIYTGLHQDFEKALEACLEIYGEPDEIQQLRQDGNKDDHNLDDDYDIELAIGEEEEEKKEIESSNKMLQPPLLHRLSSQDYQEIKENENNREIQKLSKRLSEHATPGGNSQEDESFKRNLMELSKLFRNIEEEVIVNVLQVANDYDSALEFICVLENEFVQGQNDEILYQLTEGNGGLEDEQQAEVKEQIIPGKNIINQEEEKKGEEELKQDNQKKIHDNNEEDRGAFHIRVLQSFSMFSESYYAELQIMQARQQQNIFKQNPNQDQNVEAFQKFLVYFQDFEQELQEEIRKRYDSEQQFQVKLLFDFQKMRNLFPRLDPAIILETFKILKDFDLIYNLFMISFPEYRQQQVIPAPIDQANQPQQKEKYQVHYPNGPNNFWTPMIIEKFNFMNYSKVNNDLLQQTYNQTRQESDKLHKCRQILIEEVRKARQLGDEQKYRYSMFMANQYQVEYEKSLSRGKEQIYSIKNWDFSQKDQYMDIHAFHKEEALKIVATRLPQIQQDLNHGILKPNIDETNHIVKINCGAGHHCRGKPVLKFAIPEYIRSLNIEHFVYLIDGQVLVRLQIQC